MIPKVPMADKDVTAVDGKTRESGPYWVRFLDGVEREPELAFWTENGFRDLSSWAFFGQEFVAREGEVEVLSGCLRANLDSPAKSKGCAQPAESVMSMAGVDLPQGKTYVLVIDTDKYSGNFDRQLCAYATGIWDEERYHGGEEAKSARMDEPLLVEAMIRKSVLVSDRDYGSVSNSIRATPGRLNDGHGNHRDANPGERGFPAYESVAVFLNSPPNADEMATIRRRVEDYCERNQIGVRSVYMVEAVRLPVVETRLDV